MQIPRETITTKQPRSSSEFNQLAYCLLITVVIGGFGIYRYKIGDHWLALFDLVVVLLSLILMAFIWNRKGLRYTGIIVASLVVFGVAFTCYVFGQQHSLWAFPCLLAPIFMVKPKKALILIVVGYVVILPPLYSVMPLIDFIRYAIALLVNLIYGCTVLRSYLINSDRLEKQSGLDALTGIGNRRAMVDDVAKLNLARSRLEYSLVVMDLDHFKQMNDRHGHIVGDKILKQFCTVCRKELPVGARLYRYGGEEFVIIMKGCAAGVMRNTQTLLAQVQRHIFEQNTRVSFSAGLAEYHNESLEGWISRADTALLQAKRDGRGRIYIDD